MTTQTRNEVLLEGIALEAPALSHENHGTRFYRFPLQVPRLSGTPDTLPVLVPEALLTAVRLEDPLRVRGQLRSFNNRSGVGNRLVLTVYAQAMEPGSGEPCNRILLSGALCKPPIFRRTPLGRSICDLMLAVSRRYGRADYLPVPRRDESFLLLQATCAMPLLIPTFDLGDGPVLDGGVVSYSNEIKEKLTPVLKDLGVL